MPHKGQYRSQVSEQSPIDNKKETGVVQPSYSERDPVKRVMTMESTGTSAQLSKMGQQKMTEEDESAPCMDYHENMATSGGIQVQNQANNIKANNKQGVFKKNEERLR